MTCPALEVSIQCFELMRIADLANAQLAQRDVMNSLQYMLGSCTPQDVLDELWDALPTLRRVTELIHNGWAAVQCETWKKLFDSFLGKRKFVTLNSRTSNLAMRRTRRAAVSGQRTYGRGVGPRLFYGDRTSRLRQSGPVCCSVELDASRHFGHQGCPADFRCESESRFTCVWILADVVDCAEGTK